ncbi:MAG: hypothetical protein AAF492_29445 [Verrucomicrobiota bacterium]
MKLQQGQMWEKGGEYYRVVEWARMSIDYKRMTDPTSGEGSVHRVTKKEFCRLLKGARLLESNNE